MEFCLAVNQCVYVSPIEEVWYDYNGVCIHQIKIEAVSYC